MATSLANPTSQVLSLDRLAEVAGAPGDLVGKLAVRPAAPLVFHALDDAAQAIEHRTIQETIDTAKLRVVGADDPTVWEKGWGEVADQLAGKDVTIASLRPQYFHENVSCRLEGRFIQPETPGFEYDAGLMLRQLAFLEFLSDSPEIVEIGCGTGINILLLDALFPGRRLIGADWADASGRILAAMAAARGPHIRAAKFNMLTGAWTGEGLKPGTAILTVHALEQLGAGWRPCLDWMRAQQPSLCVHIEPFVELYDRADPTDLLAASYHEKRNYLSGFLPAIRALAATGEAEIDVERRVYFGGRYHEAWSILVWRPKTAP